MKDAVWNDIDKLRELCAELYEALEAARNDLEHDLAFHHSMDAEEISGDPTIIKIDAALAKARQQEGQ